MTLKINGPLGLGLNSPSKASRNSGAGFALNGADRSSSVNASVDVASSFGVGGIGALLALQAEDDVLTGRRRRQIKRANDILTALEDLKISLLSGVIEDGALVDLQKMIEAQREMVEDEALQGVLNDIETRAYVELAKRKLM
jgi:hypothetical protein